MAPPPTKKEIEKMVPKDRDEKFWRRILILIGIAGAVIVFTHFLKRKGVRTVEVADPEVLKELQQEWKEAFALKLSPREEVIVHYNLLHEGLQRVHYLDHETPPSCIVKDDLSDYNELLVSPAQSVTDIFSRTFYGDKDLQRDDLKRFRSSLKSILKTYRLY